jgi:hypothetical protein
MIEDNMGNSRRPNLSRRTFIRNAALVLGGASLYSLNGWKTWSTLKKMLPFKKPAASHARTGDISVGTKIDVISGSVDASGGYLNFTKAG